MSECTQENLTHTQRKCLSRGTESQRISGRVSLWDLKAHHQCLSLTPYKPGARF